MDPSWIRRRRAVRDLVRLGWRVDDVAAALGIGLATAYRYRSEQLRRADSLRSEVASLRGELARD